MTGVQTCALPICNENELSYFYWNSSIDGKLHEGSNPLNINFVLSSSTFHTGEHNVTLQVRDNNGTWSLINAEFLLTKLILQQIKQLMCWVLTIERQDIMLKLIIFLLIQIELRKKY